MVTRRLVNPGDLVQAATSTRTAPLFSLQKLDTVRVFADVPEASAAGIRPGLPADVKFYGPAGVTVHGTVTRIANALDPATRTMRVEIDLPNPGEKLLPGMYAQVTLGPEPQLGGPAQAGTPHGQGRKTMRRRFALAHGADGISSAVRERLRGRDEPAAFASIGCASHSAGRFPESRRIANSADVRRRLLAVDLPTVVRVAMARNLDIQEALQRVEASRGAYESSVGAIFPSITPNVTALGLEGAISNPIVGIELATKTFVPAAAAIQWIINPGQVAYDIVASKRRLEASAQQEQAVVLETTRVAAVQYYDLVLTQAQVSVARQTMKEAEELLRIERLRLKTGTGLPADELRAEAALAGARQDLLTAVKGFYDASVTLTVTLHLDSTVMLAPRAGTMKQTTLVREDLPIDDMLVTAVRYRPDLEAVRTLWAAAQADQGATVWGGLGPQVQAARTFADATAGKRGGRYHVPAAEIRGDRWLQLERRDFRKDQERGRQREDCRARLGPRVGSRRFHRGLGAPGQPHGGEAHPDRQAAGHVG